MKALLLSIMLFGCATTAQTPVAQQESLWPLPLDGCPAYQIHVNTNVKGLRFDPADKNDRATLKTTIEGCGRNYGTRSPCLKILAKYDHFGFHATCGAKK
jgi:hypothetical protein